MNRVLLWSVIALAVVVGASSSVEAQRGRGGGPAAGPPQPARTVAPIDLTGYWVSIVTMDWRWRMMTPAKGDFGGIPLNPEGQKIAQGWDPAKDEAAGEQCKSYGAAALMGVPGRLHITWENENTLRVDTDAGTQTRLLRFDLKAAPADAQPSWQGVSIAQWRLPGPNVPVQLRPAERTAGEDLLTGPRGGSLQVVTTKMRAGYLRKNGVPYSDDAVLTEYWDVFTHANGDQWLTITTQVDDPKFLRQARLVAWPFKREKDGSKWDPTPCSAR